MLLLKLNGFAVDSYVVNIFRSCVQCYTHAHVIVHGKTGLVRT